MSFPNSRKMVTSGLCKLMIDKLLNEVVGLIF